MVNSDSGLQLRSNSTAESKCRSKEEIQTNLLKMSTDSNDGSKITVSSDTSEDQYPLARQTTEDHCLLPRHTIEVHHPLPRHTIEVHHPLPRHTIEQHHPLPRHTIEQHHPLPRHTIEVHLPLPRHTIEEHHPLPRHTIEEHHPLPRHTIEEHHPLPRHTIEEHHPLPRHTIEEHHLLPRHTIENQYAFPRHSIEDKYPIPKDIIELKDEDHSYGPYSVDAVIRQTTPAIYRPSMDENRNTEDIYLTDDQQYEGDSTMNFLKKIENGRSLTQDTNDSSQGNSQIDKPNQYVIAKLEGQAEHGTIQMDNSVVPCFDIQVTGHTTNGNASSSRRVKFNLNDYSGSSPYRGSSPPRTNMPFGRTKTSKDYLINSENSARKPSYSSILQNKMMSMYKDRGNEHLDRIYTHTNPTSHKNSGYFSREPSFVNASRQRRDDIDIISAPSEFPPANQLDGWMDGGLDSSSPIRRHGHSSFSTNHLPPRSSVQHVSIGLAQLLRREQLHRDAENNTNDCPTKTSTRWLTEGSPPMDLDPDSPPPTVPRKQRRSRVSYRLKQDERQNMNSQKMLPTAHRMMQADYSHMLSNDECSRKRKLTYRPLPGSMSGQTVLSFR